MKYLDPGNYFGLDVSSDFYDVGLKIIGTELVQEKKPKLAPLSPASIAEATAFEADFVIANAVALHVHPDENRHFFESVSMIAAKPGAICFSA